MNLLVTGAAGYIGASFSYEALKKGFRVYGCDNFINSDETNIKILENKFPNGFIFEKIDLSTELEKVKNFISNKQIECVIHFASLKSVEESEKIPKLSFAIVEKCFAFFTQSCLTSYFVIKSIIFKKSLLLVLFLLIINSIIFFSLLSHLL